MFGDYERFCEQMRAEQDAANWERMKQGPRFDASTGELVIPAHYYDTLKTPRAAHEWRARQFDYNKARHEWRRAIPATHAQEQVQKARAVFAAIWGIAQGGAQ